MMHSRMAPPPRLCGPRVGIRSVRRSDLLGHPSALGLTEQIADRFPGGDNISPHLRVASRRMGSIWVESLGPGATDINCDQGAREVLRLRPGVDYFEEAVYFRTRQEAQQFVDAFKPAWSAPLKLPSTVETEGGQFRTTLRRGQRQPGRNAGYFSLVGAPAGQSRSSTRHAGRST